jgi:hypothetical protein
MATKPGASGGKSAAPAAGGKTPAGGKGGTPATGKPASGAAPTSRPGKGSK